MAITNLCSFHQQRLLQNATALHPDHYAKLSNRRGVNKLLLPPDTSSLQPIVAKSWIEVVTERALPYFPTFWHRGDVHKQSIANLPIVNNIRTQSIHGKSRMVWKPGHGAIEKVDRITGEIMHLVEEFIDKRGKASTSLI